MKLNIIKLCAALLLLFSCFFEPSLRLMHVFSESFNNEIEVLIDPGHGGIDGGAVGASGIVEKEINLKISQKLSAVFGLYGVSSALTRNDDCLLSSDLADTVRRKKNADLRKRVELANGMKRACLISVHLNAYPDNSCRGSQVFYSPNTDGSERLAKLIQSCMVSGLNPENHRVAKRSEHGHYLLQNVFCPAVIVECGFLSNPHEEQLLSDDSYQTKVAVCIAEGYLKYRKKR